MTIELSKWDEELRKFEIVRQLTRVELVPGILVFIGATLAATSLVANYVGLGHEIGPKHYLFLISGVVLMPVGIALDVALKGHSLAETRRFIAITVQVGLLSYAFQLYQLENAAFYRFVAVLVSFGFVVNHYLPKVLRLPFFFGLSIAALFGVFTPAGPTTALLTISVALGLIGVCHLPIPLRARIAILFGYGGVLAAIRVGWIGLDGSSIMMPVLASMFMFRLPIYLYDIANNKGTANIWHRLSYFFMLPNVVFPFFPVVDYATFIRTYYNDEPLAIYQRGAYWMLRGLLHLLIYRIVYYYFVLPASEVVNPLTFLQFVVANFALYFRISGLFHLIVGILLLFGFNLHETHSAFYFSSSFIDFWRRINIYWKDFMQKMFFNPSFVFFKKRGAPYTTSLVLSIVVVFIATWAAHSYQWFWLTNNVLLTPQDGMFWAILAALLIVQTLRESRPRAMVQRAGLLGPRSFLVVRTVCMMFFLCLLWSLWTCQNLSAWIQMVAASGLVPVLGDAPILGVAPWLISLASVTTVFSAAAIAAGFSFGLNPQSTDNLHENPQLLPKGPRWRLSATTAALVAALIVLELPGVGASLGGNVKQFADDISESRLNASDQALLTEGYYEKLTNVNRFNSQLWEIYMKRPADIASWNENPPQRTATDYPFLGYEAIPNLTHTFNGITYQTNRLGMRDVEHDLTTPPGTFRIAALGGSRLMGAGVQFHDTFASRLQNLLNAGEANNNFQKFEVLNFGVNGYEPFQRLFLLEHIVLPYNPETVLYVAHLLDLNVINFAKVYQSGASIPFDFMLEISNRAHIERTMSPQQITAKLEPFRFEILSDIYNRFVHDCKKRGITPIWVYVPQAEAHEDAKTIARIKALAEKAGFAIIDLSQVFEGRDTSTLRIHAWDVHPNAQGHLLIANALLDGLKKLGKDGKLNAGLLW